MTMGTPTMVIGPRIRMLGSTAHLTCSRHSFQINDLIAWLLRHRERNSSPPACRRGQSRRLPDRWVVHPRRGYRGIRNGAQFARWDWPRSETVHSRFAVREAGPGWEAEFEAG